MTVRRLRWLAAMVVAAVAAVATPARSVAATQIIVSEYDTTTNATLNTQAFTIATLPSAGSPFSFAGGNFRDISITMTTTSPSGPSSFHSLTSTFGAKPTSGTFDTNIGLRISFLDDGYQITAANIGGDGVLSGNFGNSSGGSVTALTGSASLSPPGTTLGPGTAGSGGGQVFTASNISNMPGAFSISQLLELRVTQLTDPNTTFGSTISTFISTSPPTQVVPAPPAALLALTALPLLGVRRVMRKKSA